MTVLIAGCGDLGTEAGLRFAALGHRVVGWRRSPGVLPPAIEGVAVDVTLSLPPIPGRTDVVVIALAADGRTETAYRDAYLGGTANVLGALERDGVRPRRVVFVSSTAVYGNDDGGWVDESTPAEPATLTGGVLRETEQLLHARLPHATVLRLSGIYGPGRTRLIEKARRETETLPAGKQWTNRIHRDDAAAAIVHLATAVDEPAPVYLGADHEPAAMGDVLSFLADQLGLPHPPRGPGSGERATGKRCRSDLLRSTGFEFAYPTFREGYRAVLAGQGARHR
ncbi:SDR family oxidoreductase [Arthrobacter sp. H5]|uniref:SDR family oxidoreductase n=1 Tax=Arthrobacter sp. H5 TaxID=1267973 RepID=UPI00055B5D6F|nr:SDR family oxidoreductase [Arthrobacter sp. H5]